MESWFTSSVEVRESALILRQYGMHRDFLGLGPWTYSRASTGDSDSPSPCERKDEPTFKPLLGKLTLFQLRASRCPFQLKQQTQDPSDIPIAEGRLLLRCLCKFGLTLQSKPGNQLATRDDMLCTELSSSCPVEIGVTPYLVWVSHGITGVA